MSGGRYESAMFWLAFGTAGAVIGLALMTIGVSRSPSGANLLASPWFDGGLGLLGVGGLLLLWALVLYMRRRRVPAEGRSDDTARTAADTTMTEAIRGYYAEREKLFKMWDRQDRGSRRRKPPS